MFKILISLFLSIMFHLQSMSMIMQCEDSQMSTSMEDLEQPEPDAMIIKMIMFHGLYLDVLGKAKSANSLSEDEIVARLTRIAGELEQMKNFREAINSWVI